MEKWGKRILFLLFSVGFLMLIYPTVSNMWNNATQSKVIFDYEKKQSSISADDYSAIFKKAKEYNNRLRQLKVPLTEYEKIEGYDTLLNINGNGVMGYITISKINIKLPIYHGTSEGVLAVGCGHLQGSSLPIGGKGNHSVITAHCGLKRAELFTHLYKLEKGDVFSVHILDRNLEYRVDQILVVEPDDVEEIAINKEKDFCTLTTCTPYGINTHRLLVRGVRTDK